MSSEIIHGIANFRISLLIFSVPRALLFSTKNTVSFRYLVFLPFVYVVFILKRLFQAHVIIAQKRLFSGFLDILRKKWGLVA